jgi:hypothetical protein
MHARFSTHTFAALLLSSLWTAGCAPVTISSFTERGVDLRHYRTYDWAPADTWSSGDPRLDHNPFFDERVRARVERELEVRGFERTTAQQPDLLVHYHASVSQEIDVRDLDYGGSSRAYRPGRPYVYDKGTLFVDLVDRATNRLVWRGWAEGSIDGVIDNQAWMESHIDEAVDRILMRLPQL